MLISEINRSYSTVFATWDYINYKLKKSKYNLKNDPVMKWAFHGYIPGSVINELKPGDMIFFYTGNCMVSWAIMYFTNSRISHVAIYIGDGKISHATTSGIVIDYIDSLYNKNDSYLLVDNEELLGGKRQKIIDSIRKFMGSPFSWQSILIKFFRIILGRDKPFYQFKFFLDLLIILLLLDIFPYFLFHKFIFTWLIIPYFIIVIINLIRWNIHPIPFDKNYVKPIDIYRFLILNGSEIYANPEGLKINKKGNKYM